MHPREPIGDRAQGRWAGILNGIGVSSKMLKNRHGPCPMCGGRDRFRFDDKAGRGTWICNHCGAGDGVKLVMQFLGLSFADAARKIEGFIGEAAVSKTASTVAQAEDRKREEMNAIWKRAKPIDGRDAAGLYLTARTGIVTYPATLRFSPDERYVHDGLRASFHPAMIARVDPSDAARAEGERAALHRTYLDGHGEKADVPETRKMLGHMPTGAAVRLMPCDQRVLGIAEGIETAFSASQLFKVPVWAALTAGLLQEWTPPAEVEAVYVFGDHDNSFTGQQAAFALAKRLRAKGLMVIVEIPQFPGQDWNDVLLKNRKVA